MSMLLLLVIFLTISALHVGGYRFFLTSKDRVEVGYEIQYAIDHINEHVFAGIGTKDNPPITLVSSQEFLVNYIDKLDLAGSPKTCRYYFEDEGGGKGRFLFDRENDGTADESLGSKVNFILTVADNCAFSLSGGTRLEIRLTAEYPLARADETEQRLTLYASSYPRISSFE